MSCALNSLQITHHLFSRCFSKGLNCVPQNSFVEALNLNVAVFGDTFNEVNKVE